MELLQIDVSNIYLDWLTKQIRDENGWKVKTHQKLIRQLHRTPFFVCDPNDQPRENDGYDLRWRYKWDTDLHDGVEYTFVHDIPAESCSILEMMIALAMRADENFTRSSESTVPFIFWSMVKNMGLLDKTDNVYDEDSVTYCLDIFNNRMYAPNGYGSLFVFRADCPEDMRNVDIWNQLCRWINENYG